MSPKRFFIPLIVLAASLGGLLFLEKTFLSQVLFHNVLAHSFLLLVIVAALFFVYFFASQLYAQGKDPRWFVLSLAFYALGILSFVHAVTVPDFGWSNDALFDIFEHGGLFLTSLILWGLIVPFSDRIKDKIYQARSKMFLGLNFLLLAGIAFLFLWPSFTTVVFQSGGFIVGFTGISFFLLLIFLLTQKADDFFTPSFFSALALLTVTVLSTFFEHEWDITFWYFHLLELAAVLLLLRTKKGKDITEILFSSFSIRVRLLFIVGLMLLVVSINGAIDFRLSQNHLQAQTMDNLTLIADLQEGQVLGWLDKIKQRAADFASDGFIRENTGKIISGDRQAVSALAVHLLENKLPLDPAVYGIHIMNLDGLVIASNQQSEIGLDDMAREEVFVQAKGAPYGKVTVSDVFEDTHFGEKNTAILAVAPLTDQNTQKIVGVLMMFIRAQGLSDIMTGKAQTELGALSTWTARKKTLETIIVNQDGAMITESKFVANAVLKRKVDTEPVRKCSHSEEIAGEWLDYRQIPIFGASMCFSNGWTLVTKIDKDEVLGTLSDYLQQNLLSASSTFLLIFLMLYLFSISIVTPLQKLAVAARKIGHGDLTARVALITQDEFGELGQTFNEMAGRIQQFQLDLQQKLQIEETNRQALGNILDDLAVAKIQIEQAKAKDEAILASIGDAVLACDKNGRVILFNGIAETLTGFSAKEVIGRQYSQVVKFVKESDGKPSNDFIDNAIKTGQATKMANHTLLIAKDGRKIPVADSASPVKNAQGEIIGCVIVFRDVTKERAVDQAKSEFVSIASHQLRTPLTGIRWLAELLKKEKLSGKGRGYLDDIKTSIQRLNALVELLLNISRLEEGKIEIFPQSIDVVDFTKKLVDGLAVLCSKKRLSLSFIADEKKIMALTDVGALQNIVQAIIPNAIEYTPEGGKIEVKLKKNGQTFLLTVSDTGIGIPQKEQAHMFQKFARASNAGRFKADGMGIGLWIAKQATELLGGKIWFKSEENKGTTFFVELPIESKSVKGTKKLV